MFHAIAGCIQALGNGVPVCMQDIRSDLASTLTERNNDKFVQNLRRDHRRFLPPGSVDMNLMHLPNNSPERIVLMKNMVTKPGWSFPGNDVCLRHLVKYSTYFRRRRLGVIVFTSFGWDHVTVFPAYDSSKHALFYLLLYNTPNSHWQRVGWKKNRNELEERCFMTRQQLKKYLGNEHVELKVR
jgi:hypothetical protein